MDSADEDPRLITVWQPWAAAIIHGGKTIENRSWTTSYRGRLYILAGHKVDLSPLARTVAAQLGVMGVQLVHGMIIGHVQLTGMDGELRKGDGRWAERGQHWWRLADPVPLAEPFPWRGLPGLQRPPAAILTRH